MIRICLITLLCSHALPAFAETILAARNLRPSTILTPNDLKISAQETSGGFSDPAQLIGLETRTAIYAGRPIYSNHVGPPAIVERNQIISLIYVVGSLSISADGRALGRGAVGERIRVMNLSSKSNLVGIIQSDGTVVVSN